MQGGVPAESATVAELADQIRSTCPRILGIAGPPGSGKSYLAAALVAELGPRAVWLPMDGFHLADVQLARLGLLERKGAPDTFDAWGYAALLGRLRGRPDHPVFAPGFARDLEQPVAGAVAVDPDTETVVTEGSYLLLDRPEWREVRRHLDAVWYLDVDDEVRRERLLHRHVEFGKTVPTASAWVRQVDDPNAAAVEGSRSQADRCVRLTGSR